MGWYDNPVWPETDGLEEVRKRGLARHAKWWPGPEGCEGKVSKRPFQDGDFLAHILIARDSVGNANSSNKIAAYSNLRCTKASADLLSQEFPASQTKKL